jgi:cobaltochelatase CobN
MAVIQEAGVACSPGNCSSEAVIRLAKEIDQKAMREAASGFGLNQPGAPSNPAKVQAPAAQPRDAPTPSPQNPTPPTPALDSVRGQEMREVKKETPIEQLIWTYALLIGLVVAGGVGYQAWRTRRESAG